MKMRAVEVQRSPGRYYRMIEKEEYFAPASWSSMLKELDVPCWIPGVSAGVGTSHQIRITNDKSPSWHEFY